MTPDELLQWVAQQPPLCVCGRAIPDNAVYFGFPASEDADEPMAFINEWHDHCLGEWGWVRDNSEWGITHAYDRDVIPLTPEEQQGYRLLSD